MTDIFASLLRSLTCERYFRKSDESEERQQASIPAQEREIGELARRFELTLVGEPVREERSAKRPGRPLFNQMMDRIEHGTANAIVTWHLDRLARNPIDGGRIIWLVGEGVLKAIVTPGKIYTNTPEDKLLMNIAFGMAANHVDQLALNVARGQRESLHMGRWPSLAKLGYIRECTCPLGSHSGKHRFARLVRDPQRFNLVKDIWRQVLDGVLPSEVLRRAREEWALTTPPRAKRGGKLLSHSHLFRILHDPFYAGVMTFRGETYQGTHEPMVSWTEFLTVQRMLARGRTNTPRNQERNFTYRGLISCGRCGALVTGRYTTNRYGTRYTYYHCCRKKRTYRFCSERAVQEQSVDEQVERFLRSLQIPPDVAEVAEALLGELEDVQRTAREESLSALRELVAQKQRRQTRLRELCASDVISPDELRRDREKLLAEERVLQDRIRELTSKSSGMEPLKRALSTVNQAVSEFRRGGPDRRRALLQAFGWNPVLKDGKVLIQAKSPFSILLPLAGSPDSCATREDVRNLMKDIVERFIKETSAPPMSAQFDEAPPSVAA